MLLTCFGLIMLYSTSAYMAEINFGDDMHYFKRQAMISVACIIMALVISMIDYHVLPYFTTILYGTAAVLMVLVKTPLGVEANGAKRWLPDRADPVPALGDRQDSGDCLSVLYDRTNGQAGAYLEGMYGPRQYGSTAGADYLCVYG